MKAEEQKEMKNFGTKALETLERDEITYRKEITKWSRTTFAAEEIQKVIKEGIEEAVRKAVKEEMESEDFLKKLKNVIQGGQKIQAFYSKYHPDIMDLSRVPSIAPQEPSQPYPFGKGRMIAESDLYGGISPLIPQPSPRYPPPLITTLNENIRKIEEMRSTTRKVTEEVLEKLKPIQEIFQMDLQTLRNKIEEVVEGQTQNRVKIEELLRQFSIKHEEVEIQNLKSRELPLASTIAALSLTSIILSAFLYPIVAILLIPPFLYGLISVYYVRTKIRKIEEEIKKE